MHERAQPIRGRYCDPTDQSEARNPPIVPGIHPDTLPDYWDPCCPLTVPQNENLSRSTTQRWLSMLSSKNADGRVFNCEDDRGRTGVNIQ